jgi:hypothetical protein
MLDALHRRPRGAGHRSWSVVLAAPLSSTASARVTNLSDGYPWGIWIAWDVVIGSALGASGFTVAFIAYILNRGAVPPDRAAGAVDRAVRLHHGRRVGVLRHRPLLGVLAHLHAALRPGELGAVRGRPLHRRLHDGAVHRVGCRCCWRSLGMVRRPPQARPRCCSSIIAIGVLLPTMHQSSLGSMLLVFGPQIDPIYQTTAPAAPVPVVDGRDGPGRGGGRGQRDLAGACAGRSRVTSSAKLMRVGQILAAGVPDRPLRRPRASAATSATLFVAPARWC